MNKYKVLVVEDDAAMAEMLKATLTDYDVTTCTGKAHALNLAKKYIAEEGLPDMVLIDLIINGEGGLDFYHWMRDNGHYAPVIFLTGCHPNSPEYVAAQQTGEVVYEKDSFSSKTLAACISEMVLDQAC